MVGTVTHSIAKQIDKIIKQYLNSDFIVSSSSEFLDKIKNFDNANHLCASVDVESLFSNVPVHETIEMI